MKKIITVFLFSFLISFPSISHSGIAIKDSIEMKYDTSLQKITKMYGDIKYLYAVFDRLYPVAIAENNQLYIFDADENSNYRFIKKFPEPFPIPKGIRAAMPLEGYGFKCACVVTGEAFDDPESRIIIFHEFVHCVQFGSVEMKLKEKLDVYNKSMKDRDYMWELNYLFPYTSFAFEDEYTKFVEALENKDSLKIKEVRESLKISLSKNEFEYMTWEEWKEGYARYTENKLRKYYNINVNDYGMQKPLSRITFYVGGSKYIDYLVSKYPKLENDMESLYNKIIE